MNSKNDSEMLDSRGSCNVLHDDHIQPFGMSIHEYQVHVSAIRGPRSPGVSGSRVSLAMSRGVGGL